MKEAQWLASTEARSMLSWLKNNRKTGKISERKWRLFSVACCQQLGKKLTSPRVLAALDVAESYADGNANLTALQTANDWALAARLPREVNGVVSRALYGDEDFSPSTMAYQTAGWALLVLKNPEDAAARTDLVREVFGNPFRPVKCLPRWRIEVVVELAQHSYDGRSFKRMKRLADALEGAGCDNAAMLDHCRRSGDHVRGCWVIDLLTGRI